MITTARIKERLNERPFRPFRLHLSDGSKQEIPHPEFAWVFGTRIFIGLAAGVRTTYGDCVKEVASLHVTHLEDVRPRKHRQRSAA